MSTTITDGSTTITPDLVLGYETRQTSRTIFHDALNGTRSATLRPASLREGRLALFFTTEQAADAARQLHTTGTVFTLASTDRTTIDMDYVLGADDITLRLDPDTRDVWILEVPYQEIPT